MSKLKAIYMSKSLDDLEKMVRLPENLQRNTLQQLCKSLKMLEKEIISVHGDEEMTYVYLMKYFSLVQAAKNRPEYAREKDNFRNIVGGNPGWQRKMDQLERTKLSLMERYAEIAAAESPPSNNSTIVAQPSDELNSTQTSSMYLSSDELYGKITDSSSSMLIFDCRPTHEYQETRIEYRDCVNIPDDSIKKGLSADRLGQSLPTDSRKLWSKRLLVDYLILVDYQSGEGSRNRNVKIEILRDILTQWDQDNTSLSDNLSKRCLLILEGGYGDFALRYPMHVTNAAWKKPEDSKSGINLDDIRYDMEYNSIDEIKMKEPDKLTNQRPIVNRDTKPGALTLQIQELVRLTESLMQKDLDTLSLGMQKHQEVSKWLDVVEQDYNMSNDSQSNVNDQLQKIIYDLVELQDDHTNNKKQYLEKLDNIHALTAGKNRDYSAYAHLDQKLNQIQAMEDDYDNRNKLSDLRIAEYKTRTERIREEERRREKRAFEEEQERRKRQAIADANERARLEKERLERLAENERKAQANRIPLIDRNNKPITVPIRKPPIPRNFVGEPGSRGKGLTGLKNLGNTCYMNSIIQCLMNIECLMDYLLNGTYWKHIDPKYRSDGEITTELAAVADAIWSDRFRYIAPQRLHSLIGQFDKTFDNSNQHDSHEFLTILMDMLHMELRTIVQKSTKLQHLMSQSELAWLKYTEGRESFFSKVFFGQIKSMVKCTVCNFESSTYESFSNISLELPQNNNDCHLTDCMDLYFNGEMVTDWKCEHCQQNRKAIKKLDISKLPPVLVIHFKRFAVDYNSSRLGYEKKKNTIKFPVDNFDVIDYLSPFERKSKPATVYNLCAVSNHYGTMTGGHYTAYCRNSLKNRWYKFDDSNEPSPMDTSSVVSHAAYILFYTST